MATNKGLDGLVSDPAFMQLGAGDQRIALAGVSKDDAFSQLTDDQTKEYVDRHRQTLGIGPVHPMPQIDMKESKAPGRVRMAAEALPFVGGTVGALGGAAATGGFGSVAGGAAGAGGGEFLRQKLLYDVFGKEGATDPMSKQGLEQTAAAAAVGGASELGAGLLSAYGGRVLGKLAAAKDPWEVGNALKAMREVAPFKASKDGIIESLDAANKALSKRYDAIVKNVPGSSDINQILMATRQYAAAADQNFAQELGKPFYNGVKTMTNRLIAAAKTNAGIPSSGPVTLKELAAFQRNLAEGIRYEKSVSPTIGGVVQKTLQQTYRDIGAEVRRLAPEADGVLKRMTDIHAAKSAVSNYEPGFIKSLALGAATNPVKAAVASPVLGPAAIASYPLTKKVIGAAETVIP